MWKAAHQHILKLVSYEPGTPVDDLAREMGLRPDEIVKWAFTRKPLGPSPRAIAARRAAIDPAHCSPDGGSWALSTAIAETLVLTRKNVVMGNGSNESTEVI